MTQRTLGEWLAYLEQLHPSAIDMGLERSQQVAARLGLGQPVTVITRGAGWPNPRRAATCCERSRPMSMADGCNCSR